MKLVFTKLETDANEIRVTFDGLTWRPYSVADIKRTGYIEFTEEDCPDLTKIKIKGKFARFNSVESVSDVELEQGVASRSLAESVQRIDSFIPSTVSEINKLVDESTLNANLGEKYYTDEVKTNNVWIDGKPIYRKVGYAASSVAVGVGKTANIPLSWFNTNITPTVKDIIELKIGQNGKSFISVWRHCDINNEGVSIMNGGGDGYGISTTTVVIIEYTKTTD